MVFVLVFIGVMLGLIIFVLCLLVSKVVDVDEVGKMFVLLFVVEILLKFLGFIVFLNIYSLSVYVFLGVGFFVEVVVYVCILGILLMVFWFF